MSISIIFIHVNNSSIILQKLFKAKTGIFFWRTLQYIERHMNVNINLSNININLSNINKFILTFIE